MTLLGSKERIKKIPNKNYDNDEDGYDDNDERNNCDKSLNNFKNLTYYFNLCRSIHCNIRVHRKSLSSDREFNLLKLVHKGMYNINSPELG
jgi:hypothetical protein